ncbi:MAG TPA: hypothetical protein VFX70_02265 [Mycobacteriales bacterium]|nr:hypothetical protein [Mycobacteriales bacterium]
MNGADRRIGGQPVTLISSCVRNPSALLAEPVRLAPAVPAVRDGDLVLVRCLSEVGAYDHVEDERGAAVRLRRGQVILAVCATRRSGTNLFGEIPAGPVRAGDRLDLLAQGGLVATCTSVPRYYRHQAMPMEVVAFPTGPDGGGLNLADAPLVRPGGDGPVRSAAPLLVVCGTSAETGKTTLVCGVNEAARAHRPGLRTAAVKACGTGRAKDVLSYRDAGYDVVTDFVDAGLASTYRVPVWQFRAVLRALVAHCDARADLIVVEIGGDLLEARAPDALAALVEAGGQVLMMVNDAMGALEGLRRLRGLGVEPRLVGAFRQNPRALAERLELPVDRVWEPGAEEVLRPVLDQALDGSSARRVRAGGAPR